MIWPFTLIARMWRAFIAAASVKIWAQIGAGVSLTAVLVVGGWEIARGGWDRAHQARQIDALFFLLVGVEVLILVALAAITGLAVNLHGGKDGIHASIDQDKPEDAA